MTTIQSFLRLERAGSHADPGAFHEGRRHGRGEWREGKRQGEGMEYYANGRVLRGRFDNDRFVSK